MKLVNTELTTLHMMKLYSIKQLQSFTGIKEHTIRIWERRYSMVVPDRTEGNMRFYNQHEVQSLMEVALLNHNGEKISNIAKLNSGQRQQKIDTLKTDQGIQQRIIHGLFLSMFNLNVDNFENILDNYISTYDIHQLIVNIIIPFLERLDLLSYKENASEIHFTVTAIRKKIISGIENITPTYYNKNAKTALLFLPMNEHFDLILLYSAYLLKHSGWQVWYLGTDISMENLLSVLQVKKPTILLTYQHCKQKIDLECYHFYLKPYLDPLPLFIAVDNKFLESNAENRFYFTGLMEQLKTYFAV